MRPQLKLTDIGRLSFVDIDNVLSIDHFACGSSYDEDEQAIQTATPFQFNIAFQKLYLKGQQYEKDGVTVTEQYSHLKVIGYLSSSDITFGQDEEEYIVREIALIGSTSQNNNICLAYGYDIDGIKFIVNSAERLVIKLDIIFENTPNISINNSIGYVAYNDFLEHVDNVLDSSTPVHGLTYVNNRLYINGHPLTVDVTGIQNSVFDRAIGISQEVEVLPSLNDTFVGQVVMDKATGYMSKVIEVNNVKTWQGMPSLLTQINAMGFLPLRQNSTPYAVGDVVKIAGLSYFQYLECIANGTTGTNYAISTITGEVSVDGTVIWLVCDMRDGLQPGDMKYRFSDTDLAGYVKDNQTILEFNKNNPIGNTANWRLLRLFRQMLNPLLYQYGRESLFKLNVSAPSTVPSVSNTPVLMYGGAVVLLNQWCNITPLALSEIDYNITLQDYIDLETYKNNNSVSNYTETAFKDAARYLLNGLSTDGFITVEVENLQDRFIKLQNNTAWISRLEDEGLPNITGGLGNLVSGSNNNTSPSYGALKWGGRGTATKYQTASSTTSNLWYDPAFKASDSNAIYGNSAHVVPKNIHLCPFIKY